MNATVSLLPCPFCGSQPEIVHKVGDFGYSPDTVRVACMSCKQASTVPVEKEYYVWEGPNKGTHRRDQQALTDSIAAWNRRH